ncbi:hypothetical protein B0H11DRAFT_2220978 [Mycena galericulata]|nr:hypothetical protein B0H11DRAFT_2220978 [Mycena galericulata]
MVYTLVVHMHAKEGADVEQKIRNKLIEASQVYSKDRGTIDWFVMQDEKDPRAWSIVERYEQESSLEVHQANPFFAAFGAYIGPLLDQSVDIRRFNELDNDKPVKAE